MTNAEYTLRNLPTERDHSGSLAERFLVLLDWSQTELEALEAGMHGQDADARALQNAMWVAQSMAQTEIVRAALDAGVIAGRITAITYREAAR